MLRYCVNLKAIRYESNRIVADKSRRVIAAYVDTKDISHGYDVIEFSNCSTEERGVSRVLLCSLKTKWRHNHALLLNKAQLPMF